MPPKRTSIGRNQPKSTTKKRMRSCETEQQHAHRHKVNRQYTSQARANENDEQTATRLETNRQRTAQARGNEYDEETAIRQETDRQRTSQARANEDVEQSSDRLQTERQRSFQSRARKKNDTKAALDGQALHYNISNFILLTSVGNMDVTCPHCQCLKFKGETPGMCCSAGKNILPNFPGHPTYLQGLYDGVDANSKHFLANIRNYNCAFQMTSFGCQEQQMPGWNPSFRVQGQVCHKIGSLLPPPDENAKFLQVYFIDEQYETATRMQIAPGLKQPIVKKLSALFHEGNNYIRDIKTAMETLQQEETTDARVVIHEEMRPAGEHERRFNAQTTSAEIGILMPNEPNATRDIVLRLRDGQLTRINELHRGYDPLQYPLLFPHGTDGYSIYLKMSNGKKVSMTQFYQFHIMTRTGNELIKGRRLYQQFLVDMYCKIETERLQFLRREQSRLRADCYKDLRDSLLASDGDANNVGQRIILPATFHGGPRYMHARQMDAMSYVQKYGRPDLFITMTTNPKWPEITSNLLPDQPAHDRPDLIARVFGLKLTKFMDFLKAGAFGQMRCWLYSIEFQKRGLPHSHHLIWLKPGSKIRPEHIDTAISAEIPSPQDDPELHAIVMQNMIHGPCGGINRNSPCMRDGACTKRFPRQFRSHTLQGDDGYPKYRRLSPTNGGQLAMIKMKSNGQWREQEVDNRWVVPYNAWLLRQMNCHVNVELCMSIKAIKYVLKYVTKGCDQAVYALQRTDDPTSGQRPAVNEIERYQQARYVGSSEAAWRILQKTMHEHFPPVVGMAVHLQNGQRVYFTPDSAHARASDHPPTTSLTDFFRLCQQDDFAMTLLYADLPTFYTWDKKAWSRRKKGSLVQDHPGVFQAPAIGRVYTVSPKNMECYFLRLLLHEVRGPGSFEDLRTVDGEVCDTYRQACQLRGLLEDDNHHSMAMTEAAATQTGSALRTLFAVILTACSPSNPCQMWENYRQAMTEDILHRHRLLLQDNEVAINDAMYNESLLDLADKVNMMGGQCLSLYGLPIPQQLPGNHSTREYRRELNYNVDEQAAASEGQPHRLTDEQRHVFHCFMDTVNAGKGGMMFLDSPGGTGKTFLINLILATIRAKGGIVLATASSGISATLISGGRTLHSTFKIPLDTQRMDRPVCSIKKGTALASVIMDCQAIIVDEAPMTHRTAYEAIDRTLRDIRCVHQPMGGIAMLLCGDFRQILPVVRNGTRGNIIDASIKSSFLWDFITVKHLTINLRVALRGDVAAANFAALLLMIGNGNCPIVSQPDVINVPDVMGTVSVPIDLWEKIYPNLPDHAFDKDWLSERAILAPLNDTVNKINEGLTDMFPGEAVTYVSVDKALTDDQAVQFPVEFLNSLEVSGIPQHILRMKIGSPIMIMRSMDPPKTTNGTRCIVTKLHPNLIEAIISTGPYKGEPVLIPRIPLIPSDSDLPFQFRRLQFPVKPCFAMTINKSQGQTFFEVGIDLTNPSFTHGMFYVACSRVGAPQALTIMAPSKKTRNVVYKEALN